MTLFMKHRDKTFHTNSVQSNQPIPKGTAYGASAEAPLWSPPFSPGLF